MDDEARLLMGMSHAELIDECQRLRAELAEASEREIWAATQLAPVLGVFDGTPFDPEGDVLVWQTFVDYAVRLRDKVPKV